MIAAWSEEVRLICTRATIGFGTTEPFDPIRTVYHLFTSDGTLVAVYDPSGECNATSEMTKLMKP